MTFMDFRKINPARLLFLTLPLPAVFLLVLVAPEPLGNGLVFGNDFPEHRIWWMQVKSYYVSQGMFPLWNPLDDFGVIYPGWLGFSVYYPLNFWLYVPYYFGTFNYLAEYLQISLHVAIAMTGILFLLTRAGRISAPSALLCSILFICNHRFIDSIRYPHTIEAMAWVPWMIYFLVKILNEDNSSSHRRGLRNWLLLCLSTCLSWLAGYGQYTYIALVFCGILLIFLSKHIRSFCVGLSSLAVGSILAAGVLVPTALQNAGSSTRGGDNISFAASYPLGSYMDMFLEPFAMDVHASSFFPVVFVIMAMLGAACCMRKWKPTRLQLGMFIGCVVISDLALGKDGLLFTFFYNNVPFYHSFRIQGRNNWITMIPLCFFSGIGMDWLNNRNHKFRVAIGLIALLLALFFLQYSFSMQADGRQFSPYVMGWIDKKHILLPLFILTLLFSLLVLILLFALQKHMRVFYFGLLLLCIIFSNSYARYVTWYDHETDSTAELGVHDFYPRGILTPFKRGSDHRLASPILIQYYANNPDADAYESVVTSDQATVASRFAFSPSENTPSKGRAQVELITFNPNRIEFRVTTNVPGDLVYFSSFSPLWKSTVDYRKGRGDFSRFTVFSVPTGETRIKMTFRPLILIASGLITIIGIGALLSALCSIHQQKLAARFTLCLALVLSVLYSTAISTSRGFDQKHLFGNSAVQKKATIETIHKKL